MLNLSVLDPAQCAEVVPDASASGLGVHGAVRAVHLRTEALGVRFGPRGSAQGTHILPQVGTHNISNLVLQPVGPIHMLGLSVVLTEAAKHTFRCQRRARRIRCFKTTGFLALFRPDGACLSCNRIHRIRNTGGGGGGLRRAPQNLRRALVSRRNGQCTLLQVIQGASRDEVAIWATCANAHRRQGRAQVIRS